MTFRGARQKFPAGFPVAFQEYRQSAWCVCILSERQRTGSTEGSRGRIFLQNHTPRTGHRVLFPQSFPGGPLPKMFAPFRRCSCGEGNEDCSVGHVARMSRCCGHCECVVGILTGENRRTAMIAVFFCHQQVYFCFVGNRNKVIFSFRFCSQDLKKTFFGLKGFRRRKKFSSKENAKKNLCLRFAHPYFLRQLLAFKNLKKKLHLRP